MLDSYAVFVHSAESAVEAYIVKLKVLRTNVIIILLNVFQKIVFIVYRD